MKIITLGHIEFVALELAREIMAYDEPIPDFSTRYPDRLESCVAMPFMKFDGKYLYPGFTKKASVLFYLMIKNHPFQNGNKRIATTALLTFLYMNNKWLKADTTGLYRFAMNIAESQPELKDSFVGVIEQYLEIHISALDVNK